jgi:hypothetical protein
MLWDESSRSNQTQQQEYNHEPNAQICIEGNEDPRSVVESLRRPETIPNTSCTAPDHSNIMKTGFERKHASNTNVDLAGMALLLANVK